MKKNKIGRTSLVFYKFVKLNKFFILKNSSLKFVVFVCQELSLSLFLFYFIIILIYGVVGQVVQHYLFKQLK